MKTLIIPTQIQSCIMPWFILWLEFQSKVLYGIKVKQKYDIFTTLFHTFFTNFSQFEQLKKKTNFLLVQNRFFSQFASWKRNHNKYSLKRFVCSVVWTHEFVICFWLVQQFGLKTKSFKVKDVESQTKLTCTGILKKRLTDFLATYLKRLHNFKSKS